jgi:hypothetical protein
LKQLLQRQGGAAVTDDPRIARIGARTCIFQPHLFATRASGSSSTFAAKVLVDDAAPFDVLKMTVLAATHETYRRCLPAFSIVADVFQALWRFEILEAGEPATVGRVSRDRIAGEPAGEDRGLYARRFALGIPCINRRRAQLRRPIGNKPTII